MGVPWKEGKEPVKKIVFRVFRYDPSKDGEPYYREYEVPVYPGMTVLEALHYIKDELDGSLTYRHSCRMGICGSCAVNVNGRPRLACSTQILHLGSDEIVVEPLSNMRVIKDLVVDMDEFFEKRAAVKPYLIRREEKPLEEGEYLMSPEQHAALRQFAYCISCGACFSVCPVVAVDKQFLGPAALAAAYRFIADPRDQGMDERLGELSRVHGIWSCHLGSDCSEVCPKNVDPALAIQLLKGMIVKKTVKTLFLPLRR